MADESHVMLSIRHHEGAARRATAQKLIMYFDLLYLVELLMFSPFSI